MTVEHVIEGLTFKGQSPVQFIFCIRTALVCSIFLQHATIHSRLGGLESCLVSIFNFRVK